MSFFYKKQVKTHKKCAWITPNALYEIFYTKRSVAKVSKPI
jgi:hypothetical protein